MSELLRDYLDVHRAAILGITNQADAWLVSDAPHITIGYDANETAGRAMTGLPDTETLLAFAPEEQHGAILEGGIQIQAILTGSLVLAKLEVADLAVAHLQVQITDYHRAKFPPTDDAAPYRLLEFSSADVTTMMVRPDLELLAAKLHAVEQCGEVYKYYLFSNDELQDENLQIGLIDGRPASLSHYSTPAQEERLAAWGEVLGFKALRLMSGISVGRYEDEASLDITLRAVMQPFIGTDNESAAAAVLADIRQSAVAAKQATAFEAQLGVDFSLPSPDTLRYWQTRLTA